MKITKVKKTNYFVGRENWNIVAECDVIFGENAYKVGITLDGLIKNAYIIEDVCLTIIRPSELPKEVYQNISSYYSDKWIDIIKAAA